MFLIIKHDIDHRALGKRTNCRRSWPVGYSKTILSFSLLIARDRPTFATELSPVYSFSTAFRLNGRKRPVKIKSENKKKKQTKTIRHQFVHSPRVQLQVFPRDIEFFLRLCTEFW